jgi:hypothetical protein
MNADANTVNTEEKYAWVDAKLENCALQEQLCFEFQEQHQDRAMDIDEANPEWNEEEYDDYMEHCDNCGAEFDTDRQLGYHQMVCLPGNNNLCADFLDQPPPLTRQNCYPLTRVDNEELIADISMEEDEELEDLVLYNIKRYNEMTFAPLKKQKTFHEHPIPEPMDICDSKSETEEKWMYSCCANCVLTDGQMPSQYCRRAYPDRIIESYSDDSDEEREIDEYDPNRVFKRADTVDDENEMEIWMLEQEAKRRYPRRTRPERLEEVAVRLFESEDEGEELIMPILEDEDQMQIPPMPVLQRQNTQWVNPATGQVVYNGNPNGSRFFDDEEY